MTTTSNHRLTLRWSKKSGLRKWQSGREQTQQNEGTPLSTTTPHAKMIWSHYQLLQHFFARHSNFHGLHGPLIIIPVEHSCVVSQDEPRDPGRDGTLEKRRLQDRHSGLPEWAHGDSELDASQPKLVGGLVAINFLFSQKYWEFYHPNWRTHIFQRGGPTTNQQKYLQPKPFIGFPDSPMTMILTHFPRRKGGNIHNDQDSLAFSGVNIKNAGVVEGQMGCLVPNFHL